LSAELPVRLVVLAAGASSRYGRPKQLDRLGPGGAVLPAYTIADALAVGFDGVVVVTRPEMREPLGAHLSETLGPDLPLVWVDQSLEAPAGIAVPAGRARPWGTGHAVLAAGAATGHGPFAVANADDWYGPEALAAIARFLRRFGRTEACLVAYPLAATLSPHGGVSRGRIALAGDRVVAVEEATAVARAPDGAVRGRDSEGREVEMDPAERVSMNLWGLPPSAPGLLAPAFRTFLERDGHDPRAEFLLPQALGTLAASGALTVRLLDAGRRWFGVTHPGDRPLARGRLAALHEDGTYAHDPLLESRGGTPCD
jgi:hypothetical protein